MSQLKRAKHLKIPLKEIKKATKDFEVCIGSGGYGKVYKGELVVSRKPTTAAIKRLDERYGQGLKEFLTEIQLLCGQKHPNLIDLLGYCDEKKEKIIVYEYAERGSLDKYLRGDNINTLRWLRRLKICVDAACGLEYLHFHVGDHQTIIHRDIKSANILIDENWVAKLSDLGLAKLSLAGLNRSDVVTNLCGTYGYYDPQYGETSIVTKESDVYSFGIVLFEVLSGRLCTNIRGNDGFTISHNSVKNYYLSKSLDEIIDPSLKEEMNSDSMSRFAAIAKRCLHDDRGERPKMDLVVKELQESLELQESFELQVKELPSAMEYNRRPMTHYDQNISRSLVNIYLPRLKQNVHEIREPTLSTWERFMAWRLFKHFDLDNDGALNTSELEALLYTIGLHTYIGEERWYIHADDLFDLHGEYIDREKGLTFNGLLLSLSLHQLKYSCSYFIFDQLRKSVSLRVVLVVLFLLLIIYVWGFPKMKKGLAVSVGSGSASASANSSSKRKKGSGSASVSALSSKNKKSGRKVSKSSASLASKVSKQQHRPKWSNFSTVYLLFMCSIGWIVLFQL